jgi:capsular polysaccharide export protein
LQPITIEGPVLLLMGPLGLFFARLARHLEGRGVPVLKLMLPLHEFGFARHQRVPFAGPLPELKPFLKELIESHGIRHVFMYGDFIEPHRLALELIEELQAERTIDGWVFELGYARPNYVTLERLRVNARSNLNQPVAFYRSLPPVEVIPQSRREAGMRWRRYWKPPIFILHCFSRYRILDQAHKLQPTPRDILCQYIGVLRGLVYPLTQASLRRKVLDGTPFMLVPLQVSTDTQITMGSSFTGMEPFIRELIDSFARHAPPDLRLVFKHHPRDRGYHHYGRLIAAAAAAAGVGARVLYFHDAPIAPILTHPACRGLITVNSSVGLQALFHAVPLKVMGQAFFNLEGLSDQQPLAGFWRNPQGSDRDLFRRFYRHLIDTTQVNGNFDGYFPFSSLFPVAPHFEQEDAVQSPGPLAVVGRLTGLVQAAGHQGLALAWGVLGCQRRAQRRSHRSARRALQALGVRVLLDRRAEPVPAGARLLLNDLPLVGPLLQHGVFRSADGLRLPAGGIDAALVERLHSQQRPLAPWVLTIRQLNFVGPPQEGPLLLQVLQRLRSPAMTVIAREAPGLDPLGWGGPEDLAAALRQRYAGVIPAPRTPAPRSFRRSQKHSPWPASPGLPAG